MEKEFVSYELSLTLKDIGYESPSPIGGYRGGAVFYYDKGSELFYDGLPMYSSSYHEGQIIAPTYSQAFRFFREKHKLHSSVDFQKLKETDEDEDIELYEFKINEQWQVGKEWFDYKYGFKHHSYNFNYMSYEEAELACLKKLIEIAKETK
jgi:hypothetical protein